MLVHLISVFERVAKKGQVPLYAFMVTRIHNNGIPNFHPRRNIPARTPAIIRIAYLRDGGIPFNAYWLYSDSLQVCHSEERSDVGISDTAVPPVR